MTDVSELTSRVMYAIRVQELHGRLFRRLKIFADSVVVLAGALALGEVAAGVDWFKKTAGAVTAIAGVMSLVMDPGAKALAYDLAQRKWDALNTRISKEGPDAKTLETWGNTAAETDPPQMDCLRIRAYNDTCKSIGASDRTPNSLWSWLASFIV